MALPAPSAPPAPAPDGYMASCIDPPPFEAIRCQLGARGNSDGLILEPIPGMTGDPFKVSTELCPRIRAIEQASCKDLFSPEWLTNLLAPMTVLHAVSNTRGAANASSDEFTGLYKPGIVHPPRQLAALLIHLGQRTPAHGPLRTVFFNANNGWTACLAAAYFYRTRAPSSSSFSSSAAPALASGGKVHGLAVNDLKTEWAACRNIRVLLERLGLSWRVTPSFDAEADAALMTYHPHARNSLTPTAFAHASTLLPMAWVGRPPPFDVCIRFGEYDAAEVDTYLRRLASWCLQIAFHRAPRLDYRLDSERHGALKAMVASSQAALTDDGGQLGTSEADVSGFSVFSALGRASSRSAVGGSFAFVNKTPAAAVELFSAGCIRDMAGCDWHKGVPLPTAPGNIECRRCRE